MNLKYTMKSKKKEIAEGLTTWILCYLLVMYSPAPGVPATSVSPFMCGYENQSRGAQYIEGS